MLHRVKSVVSKLFNTARGRATLGTCILLVTSFIIFSRLNTQRIYAYSDSDNIQPVIADDNSSSKVLGGISDKLATNETARISDVNDSTNVANVNLVTFFPVTLTCDGSTQTVLAESETVRSFLAGLGITLSDHDKVTPSADTVLTENAAITVTRVNTKVVTVYKPIPYSTTYRETNALKEGVMKVSVDGKEGQHKYIYKIVYENGVEVSRALSDDYVSSKPVTKIVIKGAKPGYITLSDGTQLRYTHTMIVEATAYCVESSSNCTALGKVPKVGTVAVDPDVIPLGTRMYIVSVYGTFQYGVAVAADTGVIGDRVDLFMNTMNECFSFGRRPVKIYFLE